jgi:hypothetical protein
VSLVPPSAKREFDICQGRELFLYFVDGSGLEHNDDFLAFTTTRERQRLDFHLRGVFYLGKPEIKFYA